MSNKLKLFIESATSDDQAEDVCTLNDLLGITVDPDPFLLNPTLRHKGVAVISGPPSSCKSTFCKQLCLSIIHGESTFLGMPLNPKKGSCLYISTEDDQEDCVPVFTKQLVHFESTDQQRERLRFVWGVSKSVDDIQEEVLEKLEQRGVDVVIVDALMDVFDGRDSNSNQEVRNSLKFWKAIASRFDCLVILLTHVNKSQYDKKASQAGVQGASALTQIPRVVIDLRPDDAGQIYLQVVKGNFLAREQLKDALVLDFDDKTLSLRSSGRRATYPSEGATRVKKAPAIDVSEVFNAAESVDGLRVQAIVDRVACLHPGFDYNKIYGYIKQQLRSRGKGVWAPPMPN